MIEKLCNKLTQKIRNKMPEIDDERAEVINYGLQLVIGEVPKTFVLILIAYILGVLKLTIYALLFIIPYRTFLRNKKSLFGQRLIRDGSLLECPNLKRKRCDKIGL